MLPVEPITVSSTVLRLQPISRMPSPAALRNFSASEVDVLNRRLAESVEYMPNDFFSNPDAEAILMSPVQMPKPRTRSKKNDDSGIYQLEPAPVAPVMDRERHLFLRLNYCRMRVARILEETGSKRLSLDTARDLVLWENRVTETRGEIVRLNVPLVLAMAKRTRISGVDYSDLISEGNLALLRSVDKFDCGRGFKFSTYACRAILKSFSRVAGRTSRYRGHFPTEFDPTLEKSDFVEKKREGEELAFLDELKEILGGNLANLNDIEQRVIRARFALDGEPVSESNRARTLEQVGELIGVTKERVRQIQNKALGKLRAVLESSAVPHALRASQLHN